MLWLTSEAAAGAKDFKFTSALPAQVLKGMAPILEPYLQRAPGGNRH